MKMILRWFGPNHDSVSLDQIRQIPGVIGVVTALHDIPAGEPWPEEEVLRRKEIIEASGLKFEAVESINVHEDIKLGASTRDKYIENYIKSLRALSKADVHLVCYNFMPIFDWMRTNLKYDLPDGSNTMYYNHSVIKGLTPEEMFEHIEKDSNGYLLPGWELNRKAEIMDLFEKYKGMTADILRKNYKYFLDAIIPVCEELDIKMAVHPDDPAWDVFGLTRIVTCEEDMLKVAALNDSVYNGFTLCTGSLGSNPCNDIPKIIKNPKIAERIHFAHIRNLKHVKEGIFYESSHLSSDGSLDMYEIVKALEEIKFSGPARPDHGRMIWGENARPGYGLYDRALGVAYLNGLSEAIRKTNKR